MTAHLGRAPSCTPLTLGERGPSHSRPEPRPQPPPVLLHPVGTSGEQGGCTRLRSSLLFLVAFSFPRVLLSASHMSFLIGPGKSHRSRLRARAPSDLAKVLPPLARGRLTGAAREGAPLNVLAEEPSRRLPGLQRDGGRAGVGTAKSAASRRVGLPFSPGCCF